MGSPPQEKEDHHPDRQYWRRRCPETHTENAVHQGRPQQIEGREVQLAAKADNPAEQLLEHALEQLRRPALHPLHDHTASVHLL